MCFVESVDFSNCSKKHILESFKNVFRVELQYNHLGLVRVRVRVSTLVVRTEITVAVSGRAHLQANNPRAVYV